MEKREKLIMAKELVDCFQSQGVDISYRYARAIIAACPHAVRARYVRFSDAWNWWLLNPGFQPFSTLGDANVKNRETLSSLLTEKGQNRL